MIKVIFKIHSFFKESDSGKVNITTGKGNILCVFFIFKIQKTFFMKKKEKKNRDKK